MKRNKFSLSYKKLFSCDMGELVPVGLTEVLPGDTFQHQTSCLLRASPLLAPVMHPVDVRLHHWFVPHRLVWDNWENFITGGPDGNNASVFPTIAMPVGTGAVVGSLADYLGVPTGVASLAVSALPFRGYGLIWNEWYRDQDLETAVTVSTADGSDTTTNTSMKNCAWEKDYFTSARPWEQKGPAVTIPLGTTAPVKGTGKALGMTDGTLEGGSFAGGSGALQEWTGGVGQNVGATPALGTAIGAGSKIIGVSTDPTKSGLIADLASVSGITVNALRQALALQRFEEARARYGSRYVEYLRYLGVRSSDARLQKPEYLGGGSETIQFSEILQTAADGTNPVGTLRGHGIAAMRSNRYRRFFEEHGYVYTFMSVRPKTIYFQGIYRHWNRRTKDEFWQSELQHIGQQAIKNKEIYAAHASPEATFGYQDRYDEYRRSESLVAGEFRTSTLNFWHLARDFSSSPALNASFVSCVPTERVFAVPSVDNMWVQANHSIQARRLVAATGKSFIY